MRFDGEALPGAHVLANVAAKHPVAHQRAQRWVNPAFVLNRQVADAAARVEHIRPGKSVSRAVSEAARAAPAHGLPMGRIVSVECRRGDDLTEEEVAAPARPNKHGVFAHKTQSGLLCVAALQHRPSVYVHALHRRAARCITQPGSQLFQARRHNIVVIQSPRIGSNAAARRILAGEHGSVCGEELGALVALRDGLSMGEVLEIARRNVWRGEVRRIEEVYDLALALLPPPEERFVGVLRDLQPLRARERERQELLSAVLHDVKGALTVILGYAELLTDPGEVPDHATLLDTLRRIGDCGAQIHALVTNFGLFTRIEADSLVAERRPVALPELLAQVVRQYATLAARANITIAVDVPEGLALMADRVQLERALANLLANAVRFTPSGGHVAVRAARERDQVVLSVTDSGPGLPAGDPEQLVGRRRAPGATRRGEGVGLGLRVVRGIAQVHGGELSLSAGPAGGTVATLRLPAGSAG